MAKYALLYERLDVTSRKQQTVISHYAGNGTLVVHHFEYIAAPLREAEQTMIAQGWQYRNTPGPQSILLKREAE